MRWKVILLLSLFGLLMGALSLGGFTRGIELWYWIAIAAISALVLARSAQQRHFLHGWFVGALSGLWNGTVQAAFFTTYAANNPASIQNTDGSSFVLTPTFVLIAGPIIGMIYGVVVGLLSQVTARILKPPPVTTNDTAA